MVHTGPGKGKTTAAIGSRAADARPWPAGRRSCNSSKAPGRPGSAPPSAVSTIFLPGTRMGEGFTWETQDRERDIAACKRAWAEACVQMARPELGLLVLDELYIALRYDYLALDEVLAALQSRRAGSACLRDRPQRASRVDRSGGPGDGNARRETSFQGRREGAGRHRVLSAGARATASIMLQGTGSSVGKSLLVAGLCRALTPTRDFGFARSSRRTCPTMRPSPRRAARSAAPRRCRPAPAACRLPCT